ncbi:amino acid adenylation domain-containing protein [Streptomyces sp. NPDC090445]|uniref:amino acid adenylation domain-containing protein n=1 Tax=Streptomyces sp. NPDC090445 TaxID=3365963 RepID=UPI003827C722
MHGNLITTLHEHAERRGSERALTFAPELGRGGSLTYGELSEGVSAAAGALRELAGPGDRVLLLLPPTAEFAYAFLGCLQAGVIAVPLSLPANESALQRVAGVARDCGARVILSVAPLREYLAATPVGALDLTWVDVETLSGPAAAVPDIASDDVAFLQYTSGSTRAPRGVIVTHGNLMDNEAAINRAFGVRPDSTVVSWLPLHHDMGLIGGLLQPLYAGARAVILDPLTFLRRPMSWLETISAEQADVSGGPNFAYDLCVRKSSAQEREGLDLSSWRVAFNGASPVLPQTLRTFTEAFAVSGFRAAAHTPCYGLAEATLLVASTEADEPSESRLFDVASLEAGTAVARPDGAATARELISYRLPDHATLRIVDRDTGERVPDGRIGEICVAGAGNGAGYWGDPEATRRTFGLRVDGKPFLRTGDLGFVVDGRLHVTGRLKDLVISRGRNLHPEDMEADVAAAHPALRPGCGAVFGTDDDDVLVVVHEVRADTPEGQYRHVIQRIRGVLARNYGVRAHTVVLAPPGAVTKTSSGKVQRFAAKQRFLSGELPHLVRSTPDAGTGSAPLADRVAEVSAGGFGAADDEARAEWLAEAIAAHLRDLFGTRDLDVRDSPASLGVESLVAVRLQHEIESLLGVRLLPSAVLRTESIAELARTALDARAHIAAAAASNGPRLTEAQRALWFIQRTNPGSYAYNVTRAFTLTADADRLTRALNAVVNRHASLRLKVRDVDGAPVAEVRPEAAVVPDIVDARSWTDEQADAWTTRWATTPFDLEHDWPVRAGLLQRRDRQVLVLSLHHIVCDVSSLSVLLSHLVEEYERDAPVPAAPYSELPAELEAAALTRAEELGAFWRGQLDGRLPVLSLPSATRRRGWAGTTIPFRVPADVSAGLAAFARREGLTRHNVLLAAFQVLLHRLSGQADLVTGVPVAGRADQQLASHVGYLVNTLPVRSSLRREGFRTFARTVQRRVLDALDHQELPFPLLAGQLDVDRESGAPPVFQAMFGYYTRALPGGEDAAGLVLGDASAALALGDGSLRAHPVADRAAQTDIALNVAELGDGLEFGLQYDSALLPRAQAEQFAASYAAVLSALVKDPAADVLRLPLLDAEGLAAVVAGGTGARAEREEHYLTAFHRHVADRPDAVAVDDGTRTLTYAELDRRANHVAAVLAEAGVGPDTNVVVCAARDAGYVAVVVGVHKAGGCYVPIAPSEAPVRAARMLSALDAHVAVTDAPSRHLVDHGGVPVLDVDELLRGESAHRPALRASALHSSYVIHTSGSTGVPKPAVVTTRGLTNHLWQMVEYFGLGPDDCIGQTAPASFDISVWQLLTGLVAGARTRIADAASPARLKGAIDGDGITVLQVVPVTISALLDEGFHCEPNRLRALVSTGEELTWDIARRWHSECPSVGLYNAYGPAECADDVTISEVTRQDDQMRPVPIGAPLPNTSVHVLDAELAAVPFGAAGEICVGGDGVGRGYLGDPRRTALAFVPDPFAAPGARLYRTGDLGRRTADGVLEYLGRADRQIAVRGLRIEPGEVEAALRELPGVVDAAARTHETPHGVSLVAHLAFGDGERSRVPDAGEYARIRQALRDRLPRHMVPSVFVRLGSLPRLGNGKVDYAALRYVPAVSDEAAEVREDQAAAAVRAVWCDLLERREIGWRDNFFLLGGHSLLALRMLDRVSRTLSVELDVESVFTNPCLDEFVEAVRRAGPRAGAPFRPTAASVAWPVPASAAQQRFWFLRELDAGSPVYNMPGVLRFTGPLDPEALERSLRAVLAAHPVLLARFTETDGVLHWAPAPAEEFALAHADLRGAVAEFGPEAVEQVVAQEAGTPFGLPRELPFRALLVRSGHEEWQLVVTIDHIVCDGPSLPVFLRRLADHHNGRPPAGPDYTYAQYCVDEHAWLSGATGLADEWQGVLSGPLVTAPPGEPGGAAGATRHWFEVDERTAAAVRECAGRTGTTPFMVFATALAAVLRGGGEPETVVLGTLIGNRDRPELQEVVGPLLNVSLLPVAIGPTDSFHDALKRMRDSSLRAYRSRYLPFQHLVKAVAPDADPTSTPFDVMVVMQPPADGTPEFAGVTTELIEIDNGTSPYPLMLDIEPGGGGYRCSLRYAGDRYGTAGIARLAERYLRVLAAGAAHPEDAIEGER